MKLITAIILLLASTVSLAADFHHSIVETYTLAYPEVPTILVPVTVLGQAPVAVYGTNGTKSAEFNAPPTYVDVAPIYALIVPIKFSITEPIYCPIADCYKTRQRR